MKKILIVLFMSLSSCYNHQPKYNIRVKIYTKINCICEFYYRDVTTSLTESIGFEDSCNKYNIGDTIKMK